LETDFPGGQYVMAEEFTEKLIEKLREYVFLYDIGQPEYKNLVNKAEAWRDISEELYQTSKFVFFTYLIGTGHHELKKNNRDENKWKLLCSPN
jgi:hypothetical protein